MGSTDWWSVATSYTVYVVWFEYISHLCNGDGDIIVHAQSEYYLQIVPANIVQGGRCKPLSVYFEAVLRIRIRRIHMFLGLPDPDPLVRDTDPDPLVRDTDPDPSITKQK
jgi:hypothetical protein